MGPNQTKPRVMGYLPNDRPPIGQLILLGLQHALTMFPATVLVALLVGFHPSTVLLASGVATIVALLGSYYGIGKFIPLYYGSSFSYIAAILAITSGTFAGMGEQAPDEFIQMAQAGIVVTGLINVLVGLIIKYAGGKAMIDKVLPPVVTGSVATVIGFSLGYEALKMASGECCGGVVGSWWVVAMLTLFATIVFSVYLQGRGFIGMLPILLGAVFGYLIAIPFGLVDFTKITAQSVFTLPHVTLPNFTGEMSATAIVSIAIMAIATIPESTAHLYQISLYVDHLADELGRDRYHLDKHIGFNLILDGIGDSINGLLGGAAGTNYGENNSLMVITRNYSGPAIMVAGVIAILMSFSGTLAGVINSVPTAVSGGLAIYLFGVIGMQGIALMLSKKVNFFDPKQLAIGAVVMIIGIGGHIGFGGFLPIGLFQGVFPYGWPAIATGALAGILLNALFLLVKPPEVAPQIDVEVELTPGALD